MFYLTTGLIITLSVALRNGTKVLLGQTLFRFHLAFTLLVLTTGLISGQLISLYPVFAVLVPATALSFLGKKEWFLLNVDLDETSRIIQASLKMVLVVESADPQAFVQLDKLPLQCARIEFGSAWPEKKLSVFQKLLRKKFRGVLPRPVIKLN